MIGLLKFHFITLLLIGFGSQVKSDASDHRYSDGDTIPIYANKVGTYSNPLETYAYYDLPFCSPDDVKDKKVNLSNMLTKEHLVSTPYKLEFLVNKEFELLCKKRLKKADVSKFRDLVTKDYYIRWYCDDLPIQSVIGKVERDHRDERIKGKYFLYNHFDFDIFYNKDRVIAVLLQTDSNFEVNITDDKEVDVDFTYSVKWMVTQQSFDERMKNYIGSLNPNSMADVMEDNKSSLHKLHGYSIVNSSFTILILIICIMVFYKRVLHKDISRYACDVEETGWKSIHGDVFRFPKHKSLFAAALGSGSQLLVLTVVMLILVVMGVFQPYIQKDYLNAFMTVYAVPSMISGYTSVSFYHQLEGTNWKKNILLTGGLYIGPLFLTFIGNNTVAVFNGSTKALPIGEIIPLFLLWILLALPLLLLGGVIGKNKTPNFEAPCKTTQCPTEVPQFRWYKGILPQMVLAGFLPFSVINILLYEILYTVWGHGTYIFYSYMSIMFVLLLIMTALVSVVMTYFQLAAKDHKWWWRSFFCGGSTGLYVFGYSIFYYFCRSDITGFMQTSFFFGYMACFSYGVFLLLGTVGFHTSLCFVRFLYIVTSK